MYLCSMETWKTSRTPVIEFGRASRYATGPIHSRISNGPTYLEPSLPFLPNRIIPLIGDTLRNKCSPICELDWFTPLIGITFLQTLRRLHVALNLFNCFGSLFL